MTKITRFIIILAALIGIAGFSVWQRNMYSKESLKLEILGPEETEVLQEVEYIVKYKNNGDARLEAPELIFEYPTHSLPVDGTSLRIIKNADDLGGAIYPGEEKILRFKARLLGKEGEVLLAKATLSYQPKNLKARYVSETTFTTQIKKVPLTFEFDLPSQLESGKDLRFRLNYYSNINYPLSNLRVAVSYPSGFEFVESTPLSLDKTEWELGLLNKAQGGRIEILGKITGEIGEEKIFQAKIGTWQEGEFILLKEVAKGITIIKPSLYLRQQINGSPQYVVSPGDTLHYEIFFKNIGQDFLNNLSLIVKLEGKAFDFKNLTVPEGTFTSGDNSIIFDWKKTSKLQFLDAGEEGEVEFWIKLKEEWPIAGSEDKNPVIRDNIYLSQIHEEFVNKVNSKLEVSQKVFFQDEIFGNSGPIPPQVGQSTTYTVTWQARNFYNDVKNVKIKANLPEYIELTGKIFPEEKSSKFAFDSQSREIIWDIGDLKVSEGVAGTPAPNISFQISFSPQSFQVGQTPEIIGEAKITGQDQWTGDNLEAEADGVDTTLPDDQTITSGGVVQ